MNLRFLLLVCSFAVTFLTVSVPSFADQVYLSENCPYGYRQPRLFYQVEDAATLSTATCPDPWICGIEPGNGITKYIGVTAANCANLDEDDTKEGGCYGDEMAFNASGEVTCGGVEHKQCSDSSGNTFNITATKSCSDYCSGDNPATSDTENFYRCGSSNEGERLSGDDSSPGTGTGTGTDSGTGTGSDSGGSGTGEGGGELGGDYNSCPTGQIWNDVLSACEDECLLDNSCGDPDTGTDPGTDSGTDSGTGSDSGSGSDPDTADGSASNPPVCDSRSSCLALASQGQNCMDGRDAEYFTYINNNNYYYDCQYCNGVDADTFQECNSCQYGFNANTGACYPVTCPFGDCATPDANNTTPTTPDTSSSSDVVAAIRDLQTQIGNGIDVSVSNLSEVTNSLDSLRSTLSSNINTATQSQNSARTRETERVLDALSELKTAVENVPGGGGSGELPDADPVPCVPGPDGTYPSGCESEEIAALLREIRDIERDIRCAVSGSSGDEENPCPQFDANENFSHEIEAGELYTAWSNTAWAQVLTSLSSAASGVSNSCNMDFDLTHPVTNAQATVEICRFIEPIASILRAFAIAIWGFLGIRHIFSA